MKKTYSKLLVIITTTVAILVSAVALALTPASNIPKALTIDTQGQPTLGKTNAPVHLVVFEDLKCPNCADYSNTLFPKIKKKYIDTGIASYTFIPLAFIQGSAPAANAALCLHGQNAQFFFPFVDYIYQHQPSEEQDWATLPYLLSVARKATPQANMTQLSHCILTNQYNSVLYANLQLAAGLMNPVATPAVFVNGMLVDPLNEKRLETLINYARQHQ